MMMGESPSIHLNVGRLGMGEGRGWLSLKGLEGVVEVGGKYIFYGI